MELKLKNVRLSFPDLFKASKVNEADKPAFQATFLLPPDHPQIAEIKQAMIAVAKEKWKDKAQEIYKGLSATDKLCLHNGDGKPNLEGYPNNHYIKARNKVRPLVIDKDRTKILDESTGRPYGGCYVNANIEIYAQDNGFGKRINASLKGVQFFRDGDAFSGGAPASEDDFDDLSDTGDGSAAPATEAAGEWA